MVKLRKKKNELQTNAKPIIFMILALFLVVSVSAQETTLEEKPPAEEVEQEKEKTDSTSNKEKKKPQGTTTSASKESGHPEEAGHHNEFKIEIASDFIRRGWALGTEDVSRRNNTHYVQAVAIIRLL
jgi:hypothetical protein